MSSPTMWLDVVGTKKMQLISICLADEHSSPLRCGNTKLIDVFDTDLWLLHIISLKNFGRFCYKFAVPKVPLYNYK